MIAQVVTIPLDYEVRADNQNLGRLNRNLAAALRARSVTNLAVGYTPLETTMKKTMPKVSVESLADYVAANARRSSNPNPVEIGYMELLGVDPELSIYSSNVLLYRDDDNPDLTVASP